MSRTQLGIYIVGSLLIADFILFGYIPSKRRLEILRQSCHLHEKAVDRVVSQSRQLASLRRRVNQYREQLLHHEKSIPTTRNFGTFIQDLSSLMEVHDLQERIIEPEEDVLGNHLPYIPVKLSCRGTYSQFFAFYTDLRDLPRLVRFDEVSFTRHPDHESEIQMTARIAIFYQPNTELHQLDVESAKAL